MVAVALPTVPLVVALAARHHPTWVPDLDLVLTELRVRDVGGPHTPLLGLPGRIGTLARQGSHPGPLSFYLLAPTYRLLGSSAFALQAATVVLHVAGLAATIAVVVRRAGPRWAVAAGVALAALVAGFGPNLLTEPWNPHLPLLWWPALLAATWAALCGDAAALPLVVLTGALCAQTHVSLLGVVAALTVAAGVAALRWPLDPARRWRWAGVAVGLALLLWAPPLVDQLRHDPGNGTLLAEHLLDPSEALVGGRAGSRLLLEHLDVAHLARAAVTDPGALGERYPTGASSLRGALVLVAWLALVATGWRRLDRPARAAVALTGAAVALTGVSASRIVGRPWAYLLLWAWALGPLLVLSAAAVAHRISGRPRSPCGRQRPQISSGLAGLVVAVLVVGPAAVTAADASATNPVVSRTVLALVDQVTPRLDPGTTYLLTWADAVHLGAHGYGMVDELERRGFDVVVSEGFATPFGRHRTVGEVGATRHLLVATGAAIDEWTRVAGAEVLARVDERTPSERAEARQARISLRRGLLAADLDDLVPAVDDNLLAVALDPRLPADLRSLADRLDVLGAEAAVIEVPVGTGPP